MAFQRTSRNSRGERFAHFRMLVLPRCRAGAFLLAVATAIVFAAAGSARAQELPTPGTPLPTPALPAGLAPSHSVKTGSSTPAEVDLQSGSIMVAPSAGISDHGASAQRAIAHATPLQTAPAPSSTAGTGVVPDQIGYASWYGSRFHGRLTASGTVYNMDELTAAHRTLPFGTRVLVTDLQTGKSVVVTINDRGPFVAGRIIDLSRAAAQAIGLAGQGVAKVRLHVLALGDGKRVSVPEPPVEHRTAAPDSAAGRSVGAVAAVDAGVAARRASAPAGSPVSGTGAPAAFAGGPAPVPSVVVQVGAFRDLANAVRLRELLSANGFSPIYERWQDYTRVVLVPVAENDLASVRQRLEKIGITSILVRHD